MLGVIREHGLLIRTFRHLVSQQNFRLGVAALPVRNNRRAVPDLTVPAEILVAVMRIERGWIAIDQERIKLQGRMKEEYFFSQRRNLLKHQRSLGSRRLFLCPQR